MTLLLDQRGDQIEIIDPWGVVKAAAENWRQGRGVMALLLKRGVDKFVILEDLVVEIARSFDREAMTLLLDQRGDEIKITEEVVKAAAGNSLNEGNEVMALLLKRGADKFIISEGLVAEIARSFDREAMTLLLDQRGDEIDITEGVVKAAAKNWRQGRDVIVLLLKLGASKLVISEDLVAEIARSFDQEAMTLLLDHRGDEIKITEGIVKAAVGNNGQGKEIIKLLLRKGGDSIETYLPRFERCGPRLRRYYLYGAWQYIRGE